MLRFEQYNKQFRDNKYSFMEAYLAYYCVKISDYGQ